MKILLFLLAFLCINSTISQAQNNLESGSQIITNYSPKEYDSGLQNWAIAQDKRGVMYFGNVGLLEFDGAAWRQYQVPNKSTVRSIVIGDDGKIYIGAVGELGYFFPDSSGKLKFHSLLNFIPKDKRDFSDVWQTFISDGKVYFMVGKYLMIWNIQKKKFKVIQAESNFHVMFLVRGTIYLREWGKGLEVLKNDSLTLLKGGEKFANERIYIMIPFPGEEGTSLIVTRTMGLFKYDGNNFIPFKTEADKFIKDNLVYFPGTVLSDGNILLGTINGGAVVIDTNGNELDLYNRENGTISSTVLYTYQDRSGSIWLATDNGISNVDYSSPVSYFDSRNNFTTTAFEMVRYNGILYAASNDGVYYLDPKTDLFNKLDNSNNQSWSFLKFKDKLLVGTFDGFFNIEKNSLVPIKKTTGNEYNVNVLRRSKLNPNRIYVGAQGLWSMLRQGDKWVDEGQIFNITDGINSIAEDSSGGLWMGTNASGLYRVIFKKDNKGNVILNNPEIKHYDKTNNLQEGLVYVGRINHKNYFATSDSMYQFDKQKEIFISDTSDKFISFFYKVTNNYPYNDVEQDSLGRIWIAAKGKLAMGSIKPDGSYEWVTSPFNRLANEAITRIYAEKDGTVWFSTGSGIIKYNFNKKSSDHTNYSALVRRVEIGEDSTIYFGAKIDSLAIPEISFKNNSVKFRYSATSFESKNANKFKTLLDGFDERWSVWSTENTKEYTNLPPGKYTFKVAALNISGVEGNTGFYSFEILPPWYRTWWAYCTYIILFGLSIFSIDRLQRRRLTLKERRRAHLREMELRAEAAESKAKALDAENERKKNVEMLSEIGKNITANLSIESIIDTVYENVNSLMDAAVFGIGIYDEKNRRLFFPGTKEKGKTLSPFTNNIDDDNRPAAWCFRNQKEIFTNDYLQDSHKYIKEIKNPLAGEHTQSVLYVPLNHKDKKIGVITSQSFKKEAYSEYHLNILRNLATFTAVAIDNADAYRQLNSTINDLKTTQEKLVTQEKLASLGALTAGIAHEIKNPLNFINNFSDISNELLDDLLVEMNNGDTEEINDIIGNLKQNLEKITNHGKRADSIVKGMLLHSRGSAGEKALTDINEVLDQYAALAYHGLRALDKDFNITFEKEYDKSIEKINVVPQDISRVFLNIINNACYAANDKKKKSGNGFAPIIKISTKNLQDKVEVRIKDNGMGIPEKIKSELFNPFFTTKPSGEGTGLGLSLSYDIVVKQHRGEIKVESKEGEGAEFIIVIPKN